MQPNGRFTVNVHSALGFSAILVVYRVGFNGISSPMGTLFVGCLQRRFVIQSIPFFLQKITLCTCFALYSPASAAHFSPASN